MKGQVASAVRSSHVCTTCQRGFCSKTSLARHVRAASNGERTNCHGLNKKRAASNNLGNCAADEHPTPEWLWQELVDAYPDLRTMKIWDPFYCDGASKKLMHKAGMMNVRHSKHDFFAALDAPFRTSTYTIVTNPPFSIKKRILHELEVRTLCCCRCTCCFASTFFPFATSANLFSQAKLGSMSHRTGIACSCADDAGLLSLRLGFHPQLNKHKSINCEPLSSVVTPGFLQHSYPVRRQVITKDNLRIRGHHVSVPHWWET
jgi:hypothetical protein